MIKRYGCFDCGIVIEYANHPPMLVFCPRYSKPCEKCEPSEENVFADEEIFNMAKDLVEEGRLPGNQVDIIPMDHGIVAVRVTRYMKREELRDLYESFKSYFELEGER